MTQFTKGPVQKLPDGIIRYELVYRVKVDDSDWKVYRMWRTARVGMEEAIGRELRDRLARHPHPFEIITVRPLGGEVPIQTGKPTHVITPEEYEAEKLKELSQFSRSDVKDRAREIGLWYPGMEEKFDA